MLREELEKLPANFRDVLILREIDGLPDREIADCISPVRLSATAFVQNPPMDVAAVVGATETDRAWNGNFLSGPNVASRRSLRLDATSGPQPGIIRGDRRS